MVPFLLFGVHHFSSAESNTLVLHIPYFGFFPQPVIGKNLNPIIRSLFLSPLPPGYSWMPELSKLWATEQINVL